MKSALCNELLSSGTLNVREICRSWDRAAFSGSSAESLRRYFNFHLEAVCDMADRAQDCGRQEQLLQLIAYLQEHYPRYLDQHIQSPRSWFLQLADSRIESIQTLKDRISAWPLEHSLLSCLNGYLDQYLNTGCHTRYSFAALHYLNELLVQFSALSSADKELPTAVEDILDQFNFNHLTYLAHQQQKLKRQLNALQPGQRHQFLQNEQARISARPEQNRYIYHPDWPGLKTMIQALIREELALSEPETGAFAKLPLNLSVAQLGYLLRLFYEQGLFATENLTEIFKFCARHLSSKRQEQISPGSLSKHFYGPSIVTAAVLRDQLTRMLGSINRTFFPK